MNDFYYWKRESLYAEVWDEPVSKVAEKYGISDVAIAKLCRRLRVPVPGRGYWARKQAGQTMKRTPLPAFKNPPAIVHRKHVRTPKPQVDSSDPDVAKIAEVERGTVPVPAMEHILVVKARQVLDRTKTDEYGRAQQPPSSPCLDVHVSKELLDRALTIMNALVFALESEGLQIKVNEQSTSVEVFGQSIAFGIEEDLRIKERLEVKSYMGTKRVNVYERSGNLAFRVWNKSEGTRAHWGDGKVQRLERILPNCVGGIFRHAHLLRIEKEAARQRQLEWERQRLEEVERARRAREEQERLDNLEKCVSSWQKAEQIRGFVDAYQKVCEAKGEPTGPETLKGEWILWARRKADWFDPLVAVKVP